MHLLSETSSLIEQILSVGFGYLLNILLLRFLNLVLEVVVRDGEIEAVGLLIQGIPLLDKGVHPVPLEVNSRVRLECLLEILNKHIELPRLQLIEAGLSLQFLRPKAVLSAKSSLILRVLAVLTPIIALFEGVLNFQKSDHSAVRIDGLQERLNYDALARLQPLELIKAFSSHDMLLPDIQSQRVPQLISRGRVGLKVLGR